jgi:hypothetical protein
VQQNRAAPVWNRPVLLSTCWVSISDTNKFKSGSLRAINNRPYITKSLLLSLPAHLRAGRNTNILYTL